MFADRRDERVSVFRHAIEEKFNWRPVLSALFLFSPSASALMSG